MSNTKPVRSQLDDRITFFQEFLKHPLQIGSVIPSSHFLERRILRAAGVASANIIVELGSGTGGTTRAILRAMPRHTRLLSIEINPNFHALVNSIHDPRFIAHLGSACELKEILSLYDLAPPDVIISGIPFSTMSNSLGGRIIATISSVLAPKGRFVAYQASNRVAELCRPILGTGTVQLELLNIPPMRVYRWEKKSS
jgi:phosphatidylethanolamine/phosphatidyl-N-methylethanolamine N-methyltransferase